MKAKWLLLTPILALHLAGGQGDADPLATSSDIEVRNVVNLPNGTVRIAQDPRDHTLYTVQQNGAISRIDVENQTRTQVFSASDHGVNGVAGFAIGPDGSFYLSSNRRGTTALGRIVQGVLVDAENEIRQWSNVEFDDPDAPIDAIFEAGENGTGLATDPTTGTRYALRGKGVISRVPSGTVATTEDHGLALIAGLVIDEDGTFFLIENADFTRYNIATITKGQPGADGSIEWFVLAETEPIEQCDCIFNHQVNGLVVDAANEFVYVNSGSRTDHGEVRDNGGFFPGMREADLTAVILRLPTDSRGLTIANDRDALRAQGLLFAEGVRNSFDLAFDGNGNLFATENSGDRDMPEEINWIRQGRHYGFPWRMGNADNPQQFADYDPTQDFLLPAGFTAVRNGTYQNDPDFPPPPQVLTDPIINLGPDADSYRDEADGQLKDASDEGIVFATLTAHRSPLGLVFDTANALGNPFQGGGFVLSWTQGDATGDAVAGPFLDASEDLLHLDLQPTVDGENYEARITRIVGNFENPIDAEIIANRIYVIEWSGARGLWEIILPAGSGTAVEEIQAETMPTSSWLDQNYPNPFNPSTQVDFGLAASGQVELVIYNLAGQQIRTLASGHFPAGVYRADWDGRDNQGRAVASGVYLYQLRAGDFLKVNRLSLLK